MQKTEKTKMDLTKMGLLVGHWQLGAAWGSLGQLGAEQSRAEQSRAEQSRAEQGRAGESRADSNLEQRRAG